MAVALDERRLQRLLELGRSLVGDLDLEVVLQRVLDSARELTGARYAALGILGPGGDELERFLTVGIDQEARHAIGDLPRGRGVLGVLIHDPAPLRLEDVGEHPQSYGFPLGHPPMKSFLGAPIRIGGGQVYGNLYLTDKRDAEAFSADDEQTLVALADWAAIAISNASRHVGVRGQRDELARAVEAFETAEAIGRALAGETELERILELIVKRSRALVDARAVVVALREEDVLVVRAESGGIERHQLGTSFPVEDTMSGQILTSGRARRLSDAAPGEHAVLPRLYSATTALMVPLHFRGQGLGVLAALDRAGGDEEFSADDERLMTAFATSAATAVATARDVAAQGLRRSLQAAERERGRWARELHDQTLQDLAALKVLLGGARRASEREQVDQRLTEAIDQVQHSISNLRGLIAELRPAALDEIGLGPALHSLTERLQAISGLDIELRVDLDYEERRAASRHAPELESTVYRLVQEALNNVIKHGGAEHATVEVSEASGCVIAKVSDDGRGFDPLLSTEGFGLLGMRERVALVGGGLDVASSPGGGTVITARLPVGERRPEAVAPLAGRRTA